jgi:hypothetical protein
MNVNKGEQDDEDENDDGNDKPDDNVEVTNKRKVLTTAAVSPVLDSIALSV